MGLHEDLDNIEDDTIIEKTELPDYVAKYLEDKKILILERSKSFGDLARKALIELGANSEQISVAKDKASSVKFIKEDPDIVLCDYQTASPHSLSFLRDHINKGHVRRERLFVFLGSKVSGAEILKAAQEDVDGFILKPCSAQKFKGSIEKIIREKQNPSKYKFLLESAKALVKDGNFEFAENIIRGAIPEHEKPCGALAVLGEIFEATDRAELAEETYELGLSHCPYHLTCLNRSMQLHIKHEHFEDAWENFQVLQSKYPLDEDKLGLGFDLAFRTGNFLEINDLFAIYKTLEQPGKDLRLKVSQALLATGRHFAMKDQVASAVKFFKWSLLVAKNSEAALEIIVDSLIATSSKKTALPFMKLYPVAKMKTAKFSEWEFQLSMEQHTADQIIDLGRSLIQAGNASEGVFKEVLLKLKELGRDSATDNILQKAYEAFPDKKQEFAQLVA